MIVLIFFTDPEKLDFPLLKKPLHFYKDRSEAPKMFQDTVKIIEAADAYLASSPVPQRRDWGRG